MTVRNDVGPVCLCRLFRGENHWIGILLARLEARKGDPETARSRLEAIVGQAADAGAGNRARRELGLVLDKLGCFGSAFERIEQAGLAEAKAAEASGLTPAGVLGRIAAYEASYGVSDFHRQRFAIAGDSPAPAFLMGFLRSGTTLTEQVLAAHPHIVTVDEEPLVYELRCRIEQMAGGTDGIPEKLLRLRSEQLVEARRFYWERVAARVGKLKEDQIFVDKNALNTLEIGLIDTVFPDAKVIFALRDPRDVCLSAFMQPYMATDMTVSFLSWEGTTAFYGALMGLWLHLRERLTLRYVELRYEDTVTDLEGQARRVLDMLGIRWAPEVLAFHKKARERVISTPTFADVTHPVHGRSVQRWRRYEPQIQRIRHILQPFIEAFGYE